jgi:hypothetical protein
VRDRTDEDQGIEATSRGEPSASGIETTTDRLGDRR